MQIIEQSLVGKHDQNSCEDGIVVTSDFVAVIDGSTSKSNRRINPKMHNGRYCMMLIADYIKGMPADTTLDLFCEDITAYIHRQYTSVDGANAHSKESSVPIPPHERLCASAVIYNKAHRQIWMIGDCQCIADGVFHDNPKPDEAQLAAHRAEVFHHCYYNEDHMLDGMAIVHDYARDMIMPDLIRSMDNQNVTYAVIDGYPICRDGIRVIHLNRPHAEVVLATDGYPFLKPTLAESEEALRLQLKNDPFNIKTFKATKGLMKGNLSFDDRAYIRFRC